MLRCLDLTMSTNRLLIYFLAFVWVACNKNEATEDFALQLPKHFPEPTYDLKKNPVTKDGFELGKKLFFDPRLSSTGQISCGDCHQQYAGFAHADHAVSHGIFDRNGKRNAQHLVNLIYQKDFFWDGGVNDMDVLSLRPLLDTLEMGNTVSQVLYTLNRLPEYQTAFKKAFPQHKDSINTTLFLKALSQFMASLISANSPYDRYVLGEEQAISESAKRGLKIFRSKCSTCHAEPLLTDRSFRSNGLPHVQDIGRAEITLNSSDHYHFKVPSLRNLTLTSPYMHDGRFVTIEEVIDFYSEKISSEPHVDPILRDLPGGGYQFTPEEKSDLKAFLYTLTDKEFSTNKKFNP